MLTKPNIELPCDLININRWLFDNANEILNKLHEYNGIFQKLGLALFIFDLIKQRNIWVNNYYYQLLGYTNDEVLKLKTGFPELIYHPVDKSLFLDRINFFKQKKGHIYNALYRIQHKKGHWIWILSHCQIYTNDENGEPNQILGVHFDCSENFHFMDNASIWINQNKISGNQNSLQILSQREKEIVEYLAKGNTSREIAQILNISVYTVRNHRKNILKKLSLHNVAALIRFASNTGIIQ